MRVFKTSKSLVEHLSSETRPIGMVPTMGALHQGHLSLIERAVEENKTALISIFINPTQFDDKTDLEDYPVNIDEDLRLIGEISNDIIVYVPKANDVYGNIVKSEYFDLGGLDLVMEGEKREGHFQGVATVVTHFLKTFSPDHAYFGEKDFQQLLIISHITRSLKLKTKVVGCPTIRESNGLAMSSRNILLSADHQRLASKLFEGLTFAKSITKKFPYKKVKSMVIDFFENQSELKLDYFKITDPETLKEIDSEKFSHRGRGFIAAYLGKIRLIDNLDMS